ncbi:hypothetical protein CcCBS67573_g01745 [Chytriomyces confervae]|uniref:Uncharacterized protein n=1 Tax=Chytriomyces confervae TaxID=246404 RepID=A0A507FPM8_9FUNG|nr:hypothetical protein CcCBS67573_g01745 [Chytriomyces confervae]
METSRSQHLAPASNQTGEGVAMARCSAQRRFSVPALPPAPATPHSNSTAIESTPEHFHSKRASPLATRSTPPSSTTSKHSQDAVSLPVLKYRKRSISFSATVSCHETFSRDEYDRSSGPRELLTRHDFAELLKFKMQLADASIVRV